MERFSWRRPSGFTLLEVAVALVILLPLLLLANGAMIHFQRKGSALLSRASLPDICHGLAQFLSERRPAPGEVCQLSPFRDGSGALSFRENSSTSGNLLSLSRYQENIFRCDCFFGDGVRSFLFPLDLTDTFPP
ncbi:MAG: prepilin-type N-terminal cleavage/methylation domain-containing protein [Puniceicoccales bacterium]|jgi:prepilin-type N-terminal cleavage/methylation domain-containing protein|nr:prepilin-type N-terminal cleavage/methylation domain-containing protein [Puniceicoccales bacterium]